MTETNICRLCVNRCTNFKQLYDDTEVYEITVKYFDPMFLNLKNLTALCFECWCHIVDFHNFQETVAIAQAKLSGENYDHNKIKTEDDNNFPKETIDHADVDSSEYFQQSVDIKDEPPEPSVAEYDSKNDSDYDQQIVPELLYPFSETDSSENVVQTIPSHTNTSGADNISPKKNVHSQNDKSSIDFSLRAKHQINLKKALVEKVLNKFKNSSNKTTMHSHKNLGHMANTKHLYDKVPAQFSTPETVYSQGQKNNGPKSSKEYDQLIANLRPFLQCELCPKKCASFTLLQGHYRETHPDDEFFIMCCERKFSLRSRLEEHLRQHNSNPLKCEACGCGFRWQITLTRHMLKCSQILNKQKKTLTKTPLECPHCRVTMTSPKQLEQHIVEKHMNRHKCDLCEKSYTKKDSLREHMAFHTGNALYTCPHCPKTFIYRSSRRMHQKREHPNLPRNANHMQ
ncbi:uncharacterized protein LOC142236995 [Haematobia irritans]|uniref:uncharacterized protein LOC142236995 n=1 Tax=Haematobia irritans TaxID=7368 RepID=UPI003F507A04